MHLEKDFFQVRWGPCLHRLSLTRAWRDDQADTIPNKRKRETLCFLFNIWSLKWSKESCCLIVVIISINTIYITTVVFNIITCSLLAECCIVTLTGGLTLATVCEVGSRFSFILSISSRLSRLSYHVIRSSGYHPDNGDKQFIVFSNG